MSHTTTTITRRFYKIKVKPQPTLGSLKPQVNRNDHVVDGAKRIPLPPLFDRSFALPVSATLRTRWWWNWKWSALSIVLVVALCGAIYSPGKSSAIAESHSPKSQQGADKVVPVFAPGINMRPMRLSSGSYLAHDDARRVRTNLYSGNSGSRSGNEMSGNAFDRPGRRVVYSPDNEGSDDLLDSGRKLELPSNVSGACNVGGGVIKELSTCLAKNGARAEQ